MASCLLSAINSGNLTDKHNLCIWSDNCGQINVILYVILYIFLVFVGIFDKKHKFLVIGHSFSAADRLCTGGKTLENQQS